MARDYKAEYAASKARAQRLGYKSEREYKAVRKYLGLPKRAMPLRRAAYKDKDVTRAKRDANRITRIRRESRQWSDAHSHKHTSRYRSSMTDDQVRRYYAAYVQREDEMQRRGKRRKLSAIREYLVPDYYDSDEWEQEYGSPYGV